MRVHIFTKYIDFTRLHESKIASDRLRVAFFYNALRSCGIDVSWGFSVDPNANICFVPKITGLVGKNR